MIQIINIVRPNEGRSVFYEKIKGDLFEICEADLYVLCFDDEIQRYYYSAINSEDILYMQNGGLNPEVLEGVYAFKKSVSNLLCDFINHSSNTHRLRI